MTGHGRHFECIQEDEDYNDARDSDNEESENTDDNYSHGLHSSSNLSKNSESSSDSELLDNSASNQIEKIYNDDNKPTGEDCMHKDFSLGDIDTYIKSLDEHGMTCGGMTGKTIGNVLDLKTTPNF